MIFNFYHNFESIYPIPMDKLLTPNRDLLGYYWVFEDYFTGNRGDGLVLRGFLITNENDLNYFSDLFEKAFGARIINGIVKNSKTLATKKMDFAKKKEEYKAIIDFFALHKDRAIKIKNEFIDSLRQTLEFKKIWLDISPSDLNYMIRPCSLFWGDTVTIKRIPKELPEMSMSELWEEADSLTYTNNEEDYWMDLVCNYPDISQ